MERLSTSLRISKVRLAFHKTACASFTGWCTYHSATSPRRPIYTRAIRASGSLDSSKSDISDNSSQTDQSSHASIDSSNPETFNSSRPNVKKYSSQRSLILSGSKEVTPEEVNDLMVKAGKPVRYYSTIFITILTLLENNCKYSFWSTISNVLTVNSGIHAHKRCSTLYFSLKRHAT